jgi:hypothetical protein
MDDTGSSAEVSVPTVSLTIMTAPALDPIDQWEQDIAADEARLDIEDGPREWVLVTKIIRREGGDFFMETGYTLHHRTCGYLRNVHGPSTISDPMRMPHAIETGSRARNRYNRAKDRLDMGIPVNICRRCAGPVREQVDFFRAMLTLTLTSPADGREPVRAQ